MTEREISMTILRAVRSFFGILVASLDAARAVRVHRKPDDATLTRLGIRSANFPAV